jgi:hypothetical protein
MRKMVYKGYAARVEFDAEDKLFVGHLAGIRDIVGFHAESMSQLQAAFREAVDDYLWGCQQLGTEPNRPGEWAEAPQPAAPDAEARFALRAERGRGKAQQGIALLQKARGK